MHSRPKQICTPGPVPTLIVSTRLTAGAFACVPCAAACTAYVPGIFEISNCCFLSEYNASYSLRHLHTYTNAHTSLCLCAKDITQAGTVFQDLLRASGLLHQSNCTGLCGRMENKTVRLHRCAHLSSSSISLSPPHGCSACSSHSSVYTHTHTHTHTRTHTHMRRYSHQWHLHLQRLCWPGCYTHTYLRLCVCGGTLARSKGGCQRAMYLTALLWARVCACARVAPGAWLCVLYSLMGTRTPSPANRLHDNTCSAG